MTATPQAASRVGVNEGSDLTVERHPQPGDELRELSTGARIVVTNYLSNVDSWRFRMASGPPKGDVTQLQLLPGTLLRERFERVTD